MEASFIPRSRLVPENVFLVVGLAAGLLTIVLTPPFKGADELPHLRRAYQVSQGGVLAQRQDGQVGDSLPPALVQSRPAGRDSVFVDFRNTALYPPIPYLPHALAIGLARGFALEPETLLYLARVAGLVASLALAYLAIRIAPIAKRVFLLLALTLMSVRQMSLVTADSVTNAAALLLLALFLRWSLAPASPPRASFVATLFCALVLSLTKITYIPLALLYFLVPADRLGGRRRQVAGFALLAGVCAVSAVAWLWLIRDLYVTQSIAPTADPAGQASFILAHPLHYGRVLLADLQRNGVTYLRLGLGYVGPLARPLALLQLTAVAVVALFDGRADVALDRSQKALVLFVFATTYALITTFNYLGWNAVGADSIAHVQGRYYIPIAPLPFLLLSNRRFAEWIPDARLTATAGCLAVAFVALGFLLVALRASS